jgi:hypothetical protein
MGVLLRADLTGNGHPIRFYRKGLDDLFLLSHSSKGNPRDLQDFNSWFSTTLLSPHFKKLEIYFALFIFLDYCIVWLTVMKFKTITICQSGITQKINISREVALFSSLTLPYQNIFGRELNQFGSHEFTDFICFHTYFLQLSTNSSSQIQEM